MRSGSREGRRREAACENRRRAVLLPVSTEMARRRTRCDGARASGGDGARVSAGGGVGSS